jgi:hypothetical protein
MIQTFMVVCKWYIQFKAHNIEKTVITLWKNTITESWHNQLQNTESSLMSHTLSASQQILCFLWKYLFTVVQITAYYQNLTHITLIHSHTHKMEAYSSIILVPVEKKLLHTTLYICCYPFFKISFNITCQMVLPFWLFNYNSVNISPSICLHAPPFFICFTLTFGDKYKY